MKPVEIAAALCLGAAGASVVAPALIQKETQAREAASLQALARAGKALLLAEADIGYLPANDWESYARGYGKDLRDPSAKGLKPDMSGWGLNRRTGLTLGDPKSQDKKEVKTSELPKDAVLLMACDENEFYPNRDGTLPLKKGEDDPRERIGTLSPYFLAEGAAILLDKKIGENLMRLRTVPISKVVAQAREDATRKIKEEWDKKTSGQAIYSGYIALETGEVSTPVIETGEAPAEVAFEVFSKTPGKIMTVLEFLNGEGKKINCDPAGPETRVNINIDLEANKPAKYAPDIAPPIGFNAEMGHAEVVAGANYKKGVKAAHTFETSEVETHGTSGEWTTVIRQPKTIPPGTQAIRLKIRKSGGDETIIRNIKAKTIEGNGGEPSEQTP